MRSRQRWRGLPTISDDAGHAALGLADLFATIAARGFVEAHGIEETMPYQGTEVGKEGLGTGEAGIGKVFDHGCEHLVNDVLGAEQGHDPAVPLAEIAFEFLVHARTHGGIAGLHQALAGLAVTTDGGGDQGLDLAPLGTHKNTLIGQACEISLPTASAANQRKVSGIPDNTKLEGIDRV